MVIWQRSFEPRELMINNVFKNVVSEDFYCYSQRDGVYIDQNSDSEFYTQNFGIQWNEFAETQLDSINGLSKSEDRLFGCSGWHPDSLKDKLVLEIGSGAGRFTEIFLKYGAYVVSVEPSNAIYANYKNHNNENLLLIKQRLENMPLKFGVFDFVFCYGVIQHTPSPERSYIQCIKYVKEDGMCTFDHYQKRIKPSPYYHPKYAWRPVTTRLKPRTLLRIVQFYIPLYLPIDTFIRRIPFLGSTLAGIIPVPCWNYTGAKDVQQSSKTLTEWAIMDTFDALGAKYDFPWSLHQLQKFASKLPLKSFHVGLGGNGIILNTYGRRSSPQYE